MAFLKKIFGDHDSRFIASLKPTLERINDLEASYKKLASEDFPKKTEEFKKRLNPPAGGGESFDDLLPEAFAIVREAARRNLNERHFDVQLVGGITLHKGRIIEMRTGEGKTLAATLPAYLNALEGKGVHIVTVNDYLARRDTVWMGQIYDFLGFSVGVINGEDNTSFRYDSTHNEKDEERDELGSFKVVYDFLRPCTRKEAYAADITYGTNHEFGFDYLRDNLSPSLDELVQREHNFAIIDEVDSILIDEARTPLIISSATHEAESLYKTFARIAAQLKKDEDYVVDEKLKAASLNDAGITKAEKLLGISNIYTEKGIRYVHHLETAVRAKALFQRDKDYVVKENQVIIVDSFTGRLQPGRRWSEGLHQAIEAKEGVLIQKESRTAASITFQNYFRFYKKLAGMTGTAKTSEEEFRKVYGVDVISIPTHRQMVRIDHNDLIFQNEQGKFKAIANKVKELHKKGQPVLIGTVSIEKNELISSYFKQTGIPHEILNAKNHEHEGEIIAQAGRRGVVTVATNMAGRGIDIKLGGKPCTKEEYEEVKKLGGLFVIGTERHEARRIDNQLRGRSGRQGDPGETQFYVSMEDELMRVFGSDKIKAMMSRLGLPEDQSIENKLITRGLESAQAKIEGFHFDARKHTLEYDDVLNNQRNTIYSRRRKMLKSNVEEIKVLLEDLLSGEKEIRDIIEEKKQEVGEEAFWEAIRRIILYVTDILWLEHLETMDYMRSSVNLRAYGQHDPLVEYKKEGLKLFREMELSFKEQVFSLIKNIHKAPEEEKQEKKELVTEHKEPGQFASSPAQGGDGRRSEGQRASVRTGEKIGRNDPCPCGAKHSDGRPKKYKHCHGKNV